MLSTRTAAALTVLAATFGCRTETNDPSFGSATQLAFIVQPASTGAGQLAPVTVEIQDAQGRRVATSTALVSVALNASPPVSMAGQATVSAVSGVATFSNLFIVTAGSGYTLVASSAALQPATSAPFNISAGSSSPGQR